MKISINTDLVIKGESVHVQTEDWGQQHQKLVARVFKHGRLLKSFEIAYVNLQPPLNTEAVKKYTHQLHQKVIDWVNEGSFE